ncbi:unnamed protein product [Durusdinium trenchii]
MASDQISPKKKENGVKQPQARSFLGALAAVAKNQKPRDTGTENEKGDWKEKGDGRKDAGWKEKRDPLKTDPNATNATTGYGRGYGQWGNQWSKWEAKDKEESKEHKGLRAWSDDEDPVPKPKGAKDTKDAKDSKDEKEDEKDSGKDGEQKSDQWSKWGSNWKKSENWWNSSNSNWSGSGWKSSNSNWWKNDQGKYGYKKEALETPSVEEDSERRQKRLERFAAKDEPRIVGATSVVCHINWSAEAEQKDDKDKDKEEEEKKDKTEEDAEAKEDEERAKQLRSGERAWSEADDDD